MSKKYCVLVFLTLIMLIITACQPQATVQAPITTEQVPAATGQAAAATEVPPPATAVAPAEPVTLRIGFQQSMSTLNVVFVTLMSEGQTLRMIYETLFRLNLDGQFVGDLVQNWSTSEDGLSVTMQITDKAKWSDGEPLTAQDVAFTMNLYKSREDSSKSGRAAVIASVEVVDDYNFIMHLESAQANLPDKLSELYILPQHIWEPLGIGDDLKNFANDQPVGSGPFTLKEWRKGEFVTFTANKEHWRKPPVIDEMIWIEYNNTDAEIQALLSGEIDSVTGIPLTTYPTVRNAENITVIAGVPSSPHIADIIFNQIDPANCPEDTKATCGGHPALRDVVVRQALSYATNKQELIEVLLLGLGIPGLTVIPDVNDYFNSDLADYPFDIAKGNQVLDDAGYVDKNGDGIREMPDGLRDLTFKLNFSSSCSSCPREAELLISNWEQLGIKIDAAAMEEDAMVPYVNPGFEHDIVLWGWYGSPDPDFMLSICATEQIVGYNSESGYSNPEYDALYYAQGSELDHARRVQMVWDMQAMLVRDVAYIIPYYDQDVYAVRSDRFAGWPTDKDLVDSLDIDTLTSLTPVQ
jgi:peptide/nickel transport system substrate-binding protein